jgi:hypothetical protein
MSITYSQAQVDGAVSYLMGGGPNGGELTAEQFQYNVLRNPSDPTLGTNQATTSYLSDFILQLQLAIDQGHSGITNSKNLCRDSFGVLNDAIFAYNGYGATVIPMGSYANGAKSLPLPQGFAGRAQTQILNWGVSISG